MCVCVCVCVQDGNLLYSKTVYVLYYHNVFTAEALAGLKANSLLLLFLSLIFFKLICVSLLQATVILTTKARIMAVFLKKLKTNCFLVDLHNP